MQTQSDINARRDEALSRARPVRPDDCRRLARLPRRGKTLGECLAAAQSPCVIGVIPAEADIPNAVESARAWLNAGADALCFAPHGPLPLARRMERVWAVSDFLEAHGRDTPLWLREGLFHPGQLAEALEAGVQTLSVYPSSLEDASLTLLIGCARAAGAECVWEIFSEADAARAKSFGAVLACAERSAVKAAAPLPHKILTELTDDTLEGLEHAPRGFSALTWEALPTDDEDAQRLLHALRDVLPCAHGVGARAVSSTAAQSAKRPRQK